MTGAAISAGRGLKLDKVLAGKCVRGCVPVSVRRANRLAWPNGEKSVSAAKHEESMVQEAVTSGAVKEGGRESVHLCL